MITRELENPRVKDLIGWVRRQPEEKRGISERDILDGIQVVGSGKGAIALVFKYLIAKGRIVNKLDEIMVADWVGSWVYNQIQPFAFPAKKFSDRTKALFVYHQYGFPQNMDKILEFAHDKKLIIIEDCAHSLASYYKGRLLGSMGDFSIYSFSKWFSCFALGGVKSKFDDFNAYANRLILDTPLGLTFIKDSAKFLYEWSRFSNSRVFKKYATFFLAMSYSLYGEALKPSRLALRLLYSKIGREISIRQKRYHYFLEQTNHLGICDHLETERITPYVIPIYCPESKNRALIRALRDRSIATGLYHFDINRNLLSPKFVQCVWIPCHGGISNKIFSDITELILKKI